MGHTGARVQLTAALGSLQMPQPDGGAGSVPIYFMARVPRIDVRLCQCCNVGRLQITAVLQGRAVVPAPTRAVIPANRELP
jgi:hypothetical protein